MLLQKKLLRRLDGESGAADARPRKSTRIPVAVAVTISGKDAAGRTFKEATRTAEIDRQGARILTSHQLALGAPLSIENPSLGQTALAKVVGHAERRSRQEPFQVDVELVELPELFETASIWGVGTREPKPEEKPEKENDLLTPTASGAVRPTVAQQAESVECDPVVASEPAGFPAPASRARHPVAEGIQAGRESPPASGLAAADSVRLAREEAVAELQKARLELQASLESRADEHQRQLAEMAASGVREVQGRSDALVQDLQSRLESTLRDFQEKGTNAVADQLQKAAADCEGRSAKRLEEQAVLTVGRLSEELRTLGAAAMGETEQRLTSLSQASAESLVRQATATIEECRNHLAESLEAQARAVEEGRIAAADSVRSAAEAALGGLEKTSQQVENSLGTSAAELERRMAEMATVLEGLEHRSEILRVGSTAGSERFPRAPNGQERENAERAAEELRGVTRDLLEHSTRQLHEQSSAIARSVRDELRASAAKLAEETRQQVAQVAGATVKSLSQQVQAISEESRDRLARAFEEQEQVAGRGAEALIGSIHEATERSARDFEMAQQKAQATVSGLGFDAERAAATIETAQLAAAASFDVLRRDADGILKRSGQRLHEQAHEAAEKSDKEIRTAGTALVEQTRKELAGITRGSVESLTREARAAGQASRDELRAVLEEFVSRSAQEIKALDGEVLEVKYESAKRQKAALERLRLEFIRLQRGALLQIGGLTRDLVASVLEGLRSSLKPGLKVGLCLAAVTTVLATCLSIRPMMRLRPEPPKEFYDEFLKLDPKRRSSEEKLARAYWECALLNVQGKYSFGKDLPDTPPADFIIDVRLPTGLGLTVDPASRIRYWGRLRLVWLLPQAWTKSYGWHTDWMRGASPQWLTRRLLSHCSRSPTENPSGRHGPRWAHWLKPSACVFTMAIQIGRPGRSRLDAKS